MHGLQGNDRKNNNDDDDEVQWNIPTCFATERQASFMFPQTTPSSHVKLPGVTPVALHDSLTSTLLTLID